MNIMQTSLFHTPPSLLAHISLMHKTDRCQPLSPVPHPPDPLTSFNSYSVFTGSHQLLLSFSVRAHRETQYNKLILRMVLHDR